MTQDVIAIDGSDSMRHASDLLRKHAISLLPVMKDGQLIGTVTDQDLGNASLQSGKVLEFKELLHLMSEVKVDKIMNKRLLMVPYDYTIEETADMLLANKVHSLPVVDHEENVIGIITETDLLIALMSVTGLGREGNQRIFMKKRGIQFSFMAEDRAGSIKELEDIFRNYGGHIMSILSSLDRSPDGHRKVYLRLYGINRYKLSQLKEELREKATLLYLVDHSENRREVFDS
jgi:acetoin utilization protein AcuB